MQDFGFSAIEDALDINGLVVWDPPVSESEAEYLQQWRQDNGLHGFSLIRKGVKVADYVVGRVEPTQSLSLRDIKWQ